MKTKVGLIYGGMSGEHEISQLSANSVFRALDLNKYEVFPIAIDKSGHWFVNDANALLSQKNDSLPITIGARQVLPMATPTTLPSYPKEHLLSSIDVFLPILHGPLYEDGCLQGLLELMNKAYVGPSVTCSALSMDKIFAKKMASLAGVSVSPFCVLSYAMEELVRKKELDLFSAQYGFPLFVKPASLGSSVGINKALNSEQLYDACAEALRFDEKILIEKAIVGQEVELALLGEMHNLNVSIAGEIKLNSQTDFYSYEAKYLDESAIELLIPARVSQETLKELQKASLKIGEALDVEGMARVDFFVEENGAITFNEINTIPGFTLYSMYPKLWEKSGLNFTQLLDELIELALKRHKRRQSILRDHIGI